MSELTIKKATRQGVKPLIVFYSESGCGKTYSALLLARGMVGPKGRIAVIDTESGRASLYADMPIFGGYEVIELNEPFSPARYVEALNLAKSQADIVVVDSGSHEWEGIGGVLDMAVEVEHKSGRPGLHCWKMPKFEHAKFIAALIRSSIPVIVCLRAKFKSRQIKGTQLLADEGTIRRDQIGKTIILKDDHTSPIQAEDFIFEATCHGEIMPDHRLRLTKWSHPSLKECFPTNAPIELSHGEAIARWCAAPGVSNTAQTPTAPTTAPDPLKDAKAKLWALLKPVRGSEGNWKVAQTWLESKQIMVGGKTVQDCTAEELKIATEKTDLTLNPPQ